mmetsp:Transcript_38810/g.63147  ORF Transcript_38810/g.63147 Transcript_38810/m.63147 type:complete len:107 (-) Transcript_38810:19-339(-)
MEMLGAVCVRVRLPNPLQRSSSQHSRKWLVSAKNDSRQQRLQLLLQQRISAMPADGEGADLQLLHQTVLQKCYDVRRQQQMRLLEQVPDHHPQLVYDDLPVPQQAP